ncbi:zinc-ribbon domain-containing protein, partial [Streptococcus suis]
NNVQLGSAKFCTNCGTTLPEEAMFCVECGASL